MKANRQVLEIKTVNKRQKLLSLRCDYLTPFVQPILTHLSLAYTYWYLLWAKFWRLNVGAAHFLTRACFQSREADTRAFYLTSKGQKRGVIYLSYLPASQPTPLHSHSLPTAHTASYPGIPDQLWTRRQEPRVLAIYKDWDHQRDTHSLLNVIPYISERNNQIWWHRKGLLRILECH